MVDTVRVFSSFLFLKQNHRWIISLDRMPYLPSYFICTNLSASHNICTSLHDHSFTLSLPKLRQKFYTQSYQFFLLCHWNSERLWELLLFAGTALVLLLPLMWCQPGLFSSSSLCRKSVIRASCLLYFTQPTRPLLTPFFKYVYVG